MAASIGLLVPAEAFFFMIKRGASKSGHCFKVVKALPHGSIVGSYEASGAQEGVEAWLQYGDSRIWESKAAAGKFRKETKEVGTFKLCFESTVDVTQTVSCNVRVAEPGQADAEKEEDILTKEHAATFEELVNKLEQRTNDIVDQQQYAITRESVHLGVEEDTNARVMWWTVLEVSSLLLLAAFQIFYLRSFFEVKQVL